MNETTLMQNIPHYADYIRILPEIVLSVFGMVIMFIDPLMDERTSQKTLGGISLVGALAAIGATWMQAQPQFTGLGFWNMVRVDNFSVFFHFLVAAITAIVILTSYEYMDVQQIRAGEYYGLILFGAVGMSLMSSAVELVLIFIALEISSISTYVLAGFGEVLPAGFICDGILLVRRSVNVRRNRIDQHCGDRRETVVGSFVAVDLRRCRADVRWPRIQSGCGPFPCLDA